MGCNCPICSYPVMKREYREGLNFCPNCKSIFVTPAPKMPSWILGVLVVLTVNWQVMVGLRHSLV